MVVMLRKGEINLMETLKGDLNIENNAKLLKEYIINNKYTYKTFSEATGINPQTINNLVNRKRDGSRKIWDTIAKATGLEFKFSEPKPVMKHKDDVNGVPNYVFDMLEVFGNTIIAKKIVKQRGKKSILKTLEEQGFDAKLRKDSDGDWVVEVLV